MAVTKLSQSKQKQSRHHQEAASQQGNVFHEQELEEVVFALGVEGEHFCGFIPALYNIRFISRGLNRHKLPQTSHNFAC